MTPTKKRLGVVLLVLLVVAGAGAAAYTGLFDAGAGTTYETPSGLEVSTNVDHAVAEANPFNTSDTLYINGVEIKSSADTALTVDQFKGTRTRLSNVDASNGSITITPSDKTPLVVDGAITAVDWEDTNLDNDEVAVVYSASGPGTLTVHGLTGSTKFAAATPTGTVVDSGTTTNTGDAQISVGSATDEALILFTPSAPSWSNPQPPNGTQLTSSDVNFQLDVNDTDVPTQQGDDVEATLVVDGNPVGSTNTTSNGTVQITHTLSKGGDTQYHWTLEDAYGETNTTSTQTISTPSTLYIRNASNASELVTDNLNVTVEFVTDNGQIITRESSTGEISLDGLTVDQEFVVRAQADGWVTRRTVIRSLYDQSSVYLINESTETTNAITFDLDDDTGAFPARDSRLFIQAPTDIKGDGNTTYETVAAGPFDVAAKFSTTLIYDTQYRLIVENAETGEQRVLGSYVPIGYATETLPIGEVSFKNDIQAGTAFGASLDSQDGQNIVRVRYQDARDATTSLGYEIYKINSTGKTLVVENTSVSVSGGSVTVSEPVAQNNSTDLTYEIKWHANRDGQPDVGGTAQAGAVAKFAGGWPIDPTVLSLLGWVAAVAFTGLVVIIDPPGAALVFVACLSLFTAIGVMTVSPISLGLGGAVAVAFNIGRVT